MDNLLEYFGVVGTIETIVFTGALIWGVILWARGILPALLRLGNGLAKRKIAVFAKGDNAGSLRDLLTDSRLFRKSNIIEVTTANDVGRAEGASVYLVHWHDWSANMADILGQKPDSCAMVVYAPYELGRIPDVEMKNLDGKRNTAVTNFRGRLLNDIITSMMTTGYES